ncbi:hypothetical protein BH10PSE6_BH10PSE6_12490 [soil metagenome]
MGRHLNQTVVMDNKPGAGGLLGVEIAVSAPPDGYTVVMASFSVLFIAPLMAGKPSMISTVTPLSVLTTVSMVIVARPDGRFADMRAVLAEAKARPGTISIGHAGNGTSNHVDILRIQVSEKVQFNIIPYKGSGPCPGPGLNDLMGGSVDLYTDQLSTSLPHIKSGKLKALLAFSPERLPSLPDVPRGYRRDAVRRRHHGRAFRQGRYAGTDDRQAERGGDLRAEGRCGPRPTRRAGRGHAAHHARAICRNAESR